MVFFNWLFGLGLIVIAVLQMIGIIGGEAVAYTGIIIVAIGILVMIAAKGSDSQGASPLLRTGGIRFIGFLIILMGIWQSLELLQYILPLDFIPYFILEASPWLLNIIIALLGLVLVFLVSKRGGQQIIVAQAVQQ